jgi:hypothetical protein
MSDHDVRFLDMLRHRPWHSDGDLGPLRQFPVASAGERDRAHFVLRRLLQPLVYGIEPPSVEQAASRPGLIVTNTSPRPLSRTCSRPEMAFGTNSTCSGLEK